jgi:hypothetical protein
MRRHLRELPFARQARLTGPLGRRGWRRAREFAQTRGGRGRRQHASHTIKAGVTPLTSGTTSHNASTEPASSSYVHVIHALAEPAHKRLKRPRRTRGWSPPRAAVSVPVTGGGELPQITCSASIDRVLVTGGDQPWCRGSRPTGWPLTAARSRRTQSRSPTARKRSRRCCR